MCQYGQNDRNTMIIHILNSLFIRLRLIVNIIHKLQISLQTCIFKLNLNLQCSNYRLNKPLITKLLTSSKGLQSTYYLRLFMWYREWKSSYAWFEIPSCRWTKIYVLLKGTMYLVNIISMFASFINRIWIGDN